MSESNSSTASAMDVNALQTVAARWLMSVHAVWNPKLENSQVDKNALRLTFTDWGSQRYTVVMNFGGDVVSYNGPAEAGPLENMLAPSPKTQPAALFSTPSESYKERQAKPATSPFQYVPLSEASPEVQPATGRYQAPEERVLSWIRESIGLSAVSIVERDIKDQLIHYRVLDEKGGNYLVVAEMNGAVKRFEPIAKPQPAATRPGATKIDAHVAPVRAPAPTNAPPGLSSSETARLISLAKNWLSNNIGLNNVEVRGSVWDGTRLKLDVGDKGGNTYRLYVRQSGKVEEFKPM